MGTVQDFGEVRFKGRFRDYQQRVLDAVEGHNEDDKLHIVAAPGSGKTVLGLELIRYLGAPALVLSPTIVVAHQWGDRFQEMFLPEAHSLGDYVSHNLKNPALITSITYQALHAAYSRLSLRQEMFEPNDEGSDTATVDASDTSIVEASDTSTAAIAGEAETEAETEAEAEVYDFRDFALIEFIRTSGIKTICLDEAHHLKREWQKALEGFIRQIEHEVTIIALTATPPYDSTPVEWDRYITLCGEIDSEILVPELVAQKTLCPHQDYIYFNFPTKQELRVLREYQDRVAQFVLSLRESGVLVSAFTNAKLYGYDYSEEWLYKNASPLLTLFALCRQERGIVPEQPRELLTLGSSLPVPTPARIESAINFILEDAEAFGEQTVSKVKELCRSHRLLNRGRASLAADPRLNRTLLSSLGKMESISAIVREEYAQLSHGLRMLILTDHIRKDYLRVVGTQTRIDAIGTVPVFETVRRVLPGDARIGLLAGTLVIWPDDRLDRLRQLAQERGLSLRSNSLGTTGYSTVEFGGGNRIKVAIATAAFQQGDVQVIVGTKSLLGEGWDSPCINSLIMASFIGSYVLSNQMRGRAIRIMKGVPDKTANIWHLVSVEPLCMPGDDEQGRVKKMLFSETDLGISHDFRTLRRRFECFFGPTYTHHEIASGIDRIDIIKPPYTEQSIAAINKEMLRRAADRTAMAQSWDKGLASNGIPEVINVTTVPKTVVPKPFVFRNLRRFLLFTGALGAVSAICFDLVSAGWTVLQELVFKSRNLDLAIPAFVLLVVSLVLPLLFSAVARAGIAFFRSINPKATVGDFARSVRDMLHEIGQIESEGSTVDVQADELGLHIECSLRGATIREQNVFSQAISELFGAIETPRYLLVGYKPERQLSKRSPNVRDSFACPSVVTSAKIADIFVKHLEKRKLSYRAIYTLNARGFRLLAACRNKSLTSLNAEYVRRHLRFGTRG
ncbi:MAG: DEAD/DEAH box helicase family protein [Coriobacteriales bacterium]|jgi:superfamily II DNA or RNA helicase|nr:DEAD/DEAH box helicase family protein [Coriobacteriales bacterium]